MLKDTWKDKVDGVDFNSADDINQVAHAVIDLENKEVKITVDDELNESSVNPVQNKVVTAKFNDVDEKIAEVKPTIIEEEYDVSVASIIMEDNHIYFFNMIMNKLEVTFPKMEAGYISELDFTTPAIVNEDYSTFPKSVIFKGDSTEDGRFVPEADKIYTIVFSYCGYIVGYVSGVSLY